MAKRKNVTRLEKLLVTAMTLALILGITVGVTAAFVLTQTEALENTFVAAKVQVRVSQAFNAVSGDLSEVAVNNDHSNIPVYIRVAVVANWRRSDGNVCGGTHNVDLPAIPDNTLGTDWVKGSDGFYYYTKPVAVGSKTSDLFVGTITLPTASDGCVAQMFFLASAIQAQGTTDGGVPAYQDAWAAAPELD